MCTRDKSLLSRQESYTSLLSVIRITLEMSCTCRPKQIRHKSRPGIGIRMESRSGWKVKQLQRDTRSASKPSYIEMQTATLQVIVRANWDSTAGSGWSENEMSLPLLAKAWQLLKTLFQTHTPYHFSGNTTS